MASKDKMSYLDEWDQLFSSSRYLQLLKESAIKGNLKMSRLRSVCWKLFLGCLPENKAGWVEMTKAQRRLYDEILDKFHTNPRNVESLDLDVNNPLSQSHQSPWNQYFQDHELKTTIQQDVVRTFPEIEFFRSFDIQHMMVNILFNYAREFPHIAYKQGMHELLAPILFVIYCDQKFYLRASKESSLNMDIHILLNQNYLEHDSFTLFCRLMSRVEAWYTVESPYSEDASEVEPLKKFSLFTFLSLPDTLKNISGGHLKRIDNELFCHLEKLEITPQIYGIRWLRLLFGREFSINELLILWDAIFADSSDFLLVDYIFVAMLCSIRGQLLQADYASCLNYLMRFPHVEDVQYIIDLALHLRDPHNCRRPEGVLRLPLQIPKNSKQIGFRSPPKPSAGSVMTSTLKIRPKSLSLARPKAHVLNPAELSPPGSRSKSSSLSEVPSKIVPFVENEPDHAIDFLSVVLSSSHIGASSTLPRTSIRNVMESRSHKFKAADLSQRLDQESNRKTLPENASRELVPMIPPTSDVAMEFKHLPKNVAEKMLGLKRDLSNLKAMTEYCTQQMTLHLNRLQECLMNQTLENEDELYISLAGLKRTKDILKGTVRFTDEVIDDDIALYSAIPHTNLKCSTDKQSNTMSETMEHDHCREQGKQECDHTPKNDNDCEYENESVPTSVNSIVQDLLEDFESPSLELLDGSYQKDVISDST